MAVTLVNSWKISRGVTNRVILAGLTDTLVDIDFTMPSYKTEFTIAIVTVYSILTKLRAHLVAVILAIIHEFQTKLAGVKDGFAKISCPEQRKKTKLGENMSFLVFSGIKRDYLHIFVTFSRNHHVTRFTFAIKITRQIYASFDVQCVNKFLARLRNLVIFEFF